ncbi:ATP-dependent DNA ligase [Streptomyces luteolifulvus]|uniref:DNA ligase (ATP) n=1 Tax=Streptomyces luteolifulvus TaxID=2615112 RepID=A0A6H9UTY3_9ACTN|nr:RNA ligase family protein [Streptomyces luteolifulvus]KAB1142422.1 ATP-dependent DNA ligase [Streptomyces luteolifulvus]MXM65423.1 ATP-dependent DNA ligase [Streptomyces sp. HUCO-GS316]
MRLPLIAPMLATPGSLPPAAQDARWAYETKQDGQRVVAYLAGDGSVVLRARSGEEITAAYPELLPLGDALGSTPAVLDGEVLALDERGRADFQLLQSRMGLAHSPAKAARMASLTPVHLVLFDVMHLGRRSLLTLRYTRRRRHLEDLGLAGPFWSTPAALVGHGEQALRATREHGLEGLVCKRLDSVYEPGVRSRAWIKIRNMRTEDVLVGGWLPGKGRLTGLPGAVLVGQRAAGKLRYVGSVGTGWSEAERTRLAELLRAAATDVCPFDPVPPVAGAHWVLPRLVGEVRYSTRTRAGLLRQPSWLRLRPDLAPEQASADLPDDTV